MNLPERLWLHVKSDSIEQEQEGWTASQYKQSEDDIPFCRESLVRVLELANSKLCILLEESNDLVAQLRKQLDPIDKFWQRWKNKDEVYIDRLWRGVQAWDAIQASVERKEKP